MRSHLVSAFNEQDVGLPIGFAEQDEHGGATLSVLRRRISGEILHFDVWCCLR
jgi:hypothetical protein